MKIPELKIAIANHSKEDLAYLVAELYKLVPKAKKEDNNLDAIITAGKPKEDAPKVKKVADKKSIETLKSEIDTFMHNAINGYYISSNKVVAKKDRPKWRFVCKAIIKDLHDILKNQREHTIVCTQFLESLYNLLCMGGNYQYFTSENPFASVGIEQDVFFMDVVGLYYRCYDVKDASKMTVELMYLDGDEANSYFRSRCDAFLESQPSEKALRSVIDYCKIELDRVNDEIHGFRLLEKHRKTNNLVPYKLKSLNQDLVELSFGAKALLEDDEDELIAFFKQYYKGEDEKDEIFWYTLVRELLNNKRYETIIRVVDEQITLGVKPRERVAELYKKIKNGERERLYL